MIGIGVEDGGEFNRGRFGDGIDLVPQHRRYVIGLVRPVHEVRPVDLCDCAR